MIGFIGIGVMGGAMVNTLLRNFLDVRVFDIDPEKSKAAAASGATIASDIAMLTKACDPVLLSLPKSEVLVDVVERSVLPNVRTGQTIIDLGTTVIADTRRIAAEMNEKGAVFLDAPVSGGRMGSAQGSLYIFVGGEREAAMKQWPLLSKLGKARLTYCGLSGSGQIVKAVNQLAMGLVDAAYIEAVAFGARAGVDPMTLMNAVGGDSGFRQRFSQIAGRIADGAGDTMDNKYAEFEYFLNEADNAGIPAPMLRALYDWMHRFPETERDNMGRPYPGFWSSLMKG